MSVITISRQKGSLGDEIAKAVAEKLKYNCVDKMKISDALADQGLQAPDFEKFDGKKPTIWQSLSNQKKKLVLNHKLQSSYQHRYLVTKLYLQDC